MLSLDLTISLVGFPLKDIQLFLLMGELSVSKLYEQMFVHYSLRVDMGPLLENRWYAHHGHGKLLQFDACITSMMFESGSSSYGQDLHLPADVLNRHRHPQAEPSLCQFQNMIKIPDQTYLKKGNHPTEFHIHAYT